MGGRGVGWGGGEGGGGGRGRAGGRGGSPPHKALTHVWLNESLLSRCFGVGRALNFEWQAHGWIRSAAAL